jgi:hypothetical protein
MLREVKAAVVILLATIHLVPVARGREKVRTT